MSFMGKLRGALTARVLGSRQIQIGEIGAQVLLRAEAEGYAVARSNSQGMDSVVLEKAGALTYLWSNEDIVTFGRNMKWI